MKRIVLPLLLHFFILNGISAQHQNIFISSGNTPNEPAIYMNLRNTDVMVGGANINNVYYSHDGGNAWNESTLSSSYGVWGDPCIISDTNGYFYFFHLSNPIQGNWIDRIVCQKSIDGGQTWNNGSYMGLNGTKAQDKEWAVVDWCNNNIYVTWTEFDKYGSALSTDSSRIMFSKSTDAGETWSAAKKINQINGDCIDSDNTVEGAVPAVGPNGEIYVSWGGPAGLVFDKSLDEGETWLDEDVFVSNMPGGWDFDVPGIQRCNGLPITVCDLSNSPHRGNIYINWSDQRNGIGDTDVWICKSGDGGNTWSNPIRVNNDGQGKHQFFTWMTVDQVSGYLYIIFYDRRKYDDNNTDVYLAVSKDGGNTFKNIKISENPFVPSSSVFFGDYTNIHAHNHVIRPIWARLQNFQMSIHTAIIDTSSLMSIEHLESVPLSIEKAYPNPFVESMYIKFKLKKSSKVSLKVLDLYGNEICRILDRRMLSYGKHVGHFRAAKYNLTSGIYIMQLSTNEGVVRKKIVYQK